jgi:Flp pilus assembly secretin CpaC
MNIHELFSGMDEELGRRWTQTQATEERELLHAAMDARDFIASTGQLYAFEDFRNPLALHSRPMRLLCLPLLAVLLLPPPARAAEPTVELAPGTQTVLDFPSIRRVAVANPTVADVKVVGKSQLLIIARQRGTTALTVWTHTQQLQRTVVVAPPRVEELSRELAALGFPSLDVRAVGEHVVVDGQVDSFGDLQTLRRAVDGLSYVKLLVRVDAKAIQAALTATAEQINAALKRNGIKSATAVVVGQRILLEGSVSDEAERHKAQLIADSYYEDLKGTLGTR